MGSLTDDEVVLRTEGPYRLMLPKDWPVQQSGNQYMPVPVEEYLSLKFAQVRGVLATVTQRLDALEQRLSQLEQNNQTFQKRIQRLEEQLQRQPAAPSPAPETVR